MVSVDWATKIITILQSDLTFVSGNLYELDTDWFRLQLKSLEDDSEGIVFERTHKHNTEVTVVGVTYARFIEIINGYSITFENGSYAVRLSGSNNNIFDAENSILNLNNVQVIAQNAAGLIVSVQGSGVTEQDKTDIINGVWDEQTSSHTDSGTFGEKVGKKLLSLANFLGLK